MSDCGHVSCRTYVTITWHDGSGEVARCHSVTARDGVLYLSEAAYNPSEARCIPLANIREYSIKEYR